MIKNKGSVDSREIVSVFLLSSICIKSGLAWVDGRSVGDFLLFISWHSVQITNFACIALMREFWRFT